MQVRISLNAKIKIGNLIWAGNVELHLHSSDWQKHGHHLDGAYNNVILHVVMDEDVATFNSLGRKIHTLLLSNPTPMIRYYRSLQEDESWLPCHTQIHSVSSIRLKRWLTQLQVERMKRKSNYISNLNLKCKGNWEETLWHVLALSFGLPLNSLPFQMTLDRIPFELIVHNREEPS